ncbi:putative disease resistance RPP13-like protein 1 [Solanum dulcamara]|uniref:putative disease resistance RPP13-like protein 1 n=1 Tax=Solanum dulcamara TaxID=45834 RepID=UPI002485E524|nr:putative disease resistance RPP13-like protein 1 [Solanum dulcamara]XP_055834481.1 putative disease resistance RPP13-like protein 1 [Solanum dulcamara]
MDIGLAVGGAFLSSALNVLFDRLAPEGDLLNMFQKHKHHVQLLKKLEDILPGLQIVLSDAENKQASNQFVRQWLNKLQNAVDGAENLIEEVNYEALRLKVEGQHQNLAETSNQQVSNLNLCSSDDFFLNIKEKLEDTMETLEDLEKKIGRLGLKEHFGSTKQETRTPSTCLVDDSDIFGRQNDIEELIGRLLSEDANGKNLSVVPIVGMGGVGKTTLAKAVYNHEKVKDHFGLKAWFCVSEAYDAFRITKGLLQEIGSFVDNNLNQLQVKLKESLKGKKFLVVLDDVWNDNYNEWDELRNLFVQGDIGSKIIVTTRKESVALMMGNEQIRMDNLSIEESWSLFKRHAFENMDPMGHPELEEVGKQIAAKCKGLPLALKTLAGMLRSKSEVKGWKRILRSEIWELPDNDILPALMLSYNDLPSHLKRCFSYCAIFPKDYPFRKEQVVHLWIANGLVRQEDEIIQDSGNQYFLELRSRSLFERVPNPSEGNIEKFLMHDLVNDLAQIASSKLCIRLEESQGSHMSEKSRHLSYSLGYCGDFEKLTPLYKLEQLRTLLPISFQYHGAPLSKRVLHNILPRLRSLRALSLSHYWIKELPDDLFIKLKLLRFLDLCHTTIKKLPDSICVLYNLETLLLSSCAFLEELPLQMEKLINLCHLDISNTRLKMPLHLSKLKRLQVLVGAKFLLSGLRMEDLGEVENLYGSLSVLELQNVVDRREALKARMKEKNHVEKLSLEWSESSADNSQTERDILDELHPHTNIKELQITGYRGTKFPNWLADHSFLKLVQLSLSNCKDCDSLPALGQLPSLKILSIRGMHRITEVTEEFYGSSFSRKPFKSLEKLEFEDMPEWKQWHALDFPKLENLSIENCPKLMGKLPENLCSLTQLSISRCPELNLETPKLFTSQLEKLYIDNCNSLTSLPFSILPSSLKTIGISGCQKLKLDAPVGEMSYCKDVFLKKLELAGCDSIDDISPELLPRARKLTVRRCQNLTRFLIPTATETLNIVDCKNVEILSVACGGTQMTSLYVQVCSKLKWLPDRMQELLPSLETLVLIHCPEIESFPEGGLPCNLQLLKIWYCKKLVNDRKEWRLQRLPCLRELVLVHDGSDEEILAGENWELPSTIQILTIDNLKTFSIQVLKSLTSLKYLCIANLPHLTSLQSHQSLPESALPSSLSQLTISYCPNLQSLFESALPSSLSQLFIRNCPNLQSLFKSALPSSLSQLTIENCPNLQSLSESALPSSLSKLTIVNCPNLQSLSELALPSSLSQLTIVNCPNLQSLLESAQPSSLSQLTIENCPNLQSLSESALPSSLSQLTIENCPNLQSLSESALPSSLSQLTIQKCPNLQSLPVKGMPSSLSQLYIGNCPLLKPLLEYEKGEYWPNIAQIPTILIDWEYM